MLAAALLASALSVGAAELCARVQDGACVGPLERGETPPGALSFLTTIRGRTAGARVAHVWRREGDVVQRLWLPLGASPARVSSTRTELGPGAWSVSVEDASGRELRRVVFRVTDGTKPVSPERLPVEPRAPEP